jgi:hypothetical protein
MGQFLVWLSGANRQVLDSTPNDRAKYVGIGTLILLPGVLGAVSMTFALTTVLNFKLAVAVPFALAWGLAIICMDRVFVVTLQRGRNWLAIPRILLALLLGLVISTPFVLQIFRPEIEQEIVKMQNAQATAFIASNAGSKVAQQIAKDKAIIKQLQTEIASGGPGPNLTGDSTLARLNQQLRADQDNQNTWYAQWQCQLYGTSQGGGKCRPGNGTLAQHSKAQYDYYLGQVAQDRQAISAREAVLKNNAQSSAASTIAQERQQLAATQAQLETDQKLQATQTANFLARNKEDTGLLVRLKALDAVTAGNNTLEEARWLLFALFVAIDLMPVLVKVLMNWAPPSSYEKMLTDEETTQVEIAENRRAVWKHTQFRAAQTIAGSSRDRLAGLNAPLPEVKENVIAARRRVEGEWLRTWEEDQMRRVANGQEITTGQAGIAPEQDASGGPWPPPDDQYRRQPGRTWLQGLRERFEWWRQPAEPAGPAAPGGSSRGRARTRTRAPRGYAWSDGLFQRRVPGDATAADRTAPRMFMREFVSQPTSPGAGPPGDPDRPGRGASYR